MSTIAFSPVMGGEWFDISFRYDPDLVALIKTVIPPAFRKWDQTNKKWSASKMWAQAFAQAARSAGHTTSGIPDPGTQSSAGSFGGSSFFAGPGSGGSSTWTKPPPQPPKPPTPPQLTENWAKELMRRTPPELREKLYKNLAKVLHEDLGGDGRLMQELNDARLNQGRTA